MPKHICIIDGHPDPAPHRLIHALCDTYADGASSAGHTVERIDIAELDFPLMATAEEFGTLPPEPVLTEREKIGRADHVLIAFPLWLGGMPAKLKAFLEQSARAEYFLSQQDNGWPGQMMKGKSARVAVSMGMPGLVYRFAMDEGALKALERGILGISGFHPLHHTIIGGAGNLKDDDFRSWKTYFHKIGAEGV